MNQQQQVFMPIQPMTEVNLPNQDPYLGLKATNLLFSGLQLMMALELIFIF